MSQLANICNLDKFRVEGAGPCLNFLSLSGSAKLPWPKTRLGRAYFALRRHTVKDQTHSYFFVLRSYRWAKLCRVVVSVAVPIGFAMFLLVCFECLRRVLMVTVRLFSIFTVKKY